MKKLFDHIKSEWFRYALETLVVIVGILVAFTLNNWVETRKLKTEELELLTNIRNALISDLDNQFNTHLERVELDIERTEIILYYLDNKLPYNDSLRFEFGVLSDTGKKNWTPSLTAYKLLESKGLDLVENDILINSILEIYNNEYPRIKMMFDNYLNNIHEYGRPIARSQFVLLFTGGKWDGMTPVDYASLRENVEFANTILVLRANSRQIKKELNEFKVNVERTIEELNKELDIKL